MNRREKILDFYLNNSYFLDIVVIISLWFLNSFFILFEIKTSNKSDLINQISSIISSSISLAGFILAALTIIASLKANIANKTPESAKNPLELFFSTTNYRKLTTVFKESIIELIFTTVVLYTAWLFSDEFSCDFIFKIIICSLTIIFLSLFRTLIVLFTIMRME